MPLDQLIHQCNAPFRCNVREANQPRMRVITQIDEFPEVGVDGHQYPVLGFRTLEQRFVARIRAKLASFENVVSVAAQPIRKSSTCTPIDEEPHGSATVTVTADRVSLAMIACA